MAFTRNPSDTNVSPATYTAEGASDLILIDQQRDISVDGSDEDDSILIGTVALSSSALYNFDVRAFDGDDLLEIGAALVQDSTFNGNMGEDTIEVEDAILTGSFVLGGKGNDTMFVDGVTGGEVNGNLGNDIITITSVVDRNFDASVRGGQGNDIITVSGDFVNSAIYGDKGADIIEVRGGGFFMADALDKGDDEGYDDGYYDDYGSDVTGSAIYGGEGNDLIENFFGDNLQLWGESGDDAIFDINVGGTSGVTIDGGEGSDQIISVSDFGATSTIDAGVGADEVALISGLFSSQGTETYVFESGDSVAATATAFSGTGFLDNGSTITFGNGVDLLLSAGNEDFIDIDFTPTAIDNINGDSIFEPLVFGDVYEVTGDYAVGTGEFTVNAGGSDFLYIIGSGNERIENIFTSSTNMIISDEAISLGQFV